jgi:hypothetical protein
MGQTEAYEQSMKIEPRNASEALEVMLMEEEKLRKQIRELQVDVHAQFFFCGILLGLLALIRSIIFHLPPFRFYFRFIPIITTTLPLLLRSTSAGSQRGSGGRGATPPRGSGRLD